jgi:hypothetical protein
MGMVIWCYVKCTLLISDLRLRIEYKLKSEIANRAEGELGAANPKSEIDINPIISSFSDQKFLQKAPTHSQSPSRFRQES